MTANGLIFYHFELTRKSRKNVSASDNMSVSKVSWERNITPCRFLTCTNEVKTGIFEQG